MQVIKVLLKMELKIGVKISISFGISHRISWIAPRLQLMDKILLKKLTQTVFIFLYEMIV